MANTNKQRLLTAKDLDQDIFSGFTNEKDRINYMSRNYSKMSISKSFGVYYDAEISQEIKTDRNINTVQTIELGTVYNGIVKEFTKNHILFELPGVKEDIICKENFGTALDNIQNYLLTHDNKMLFEIRSREPGKIIVSVINAYYRVWVAMIEKAIKHEQGITVHIDSLVKGGYLCHTDISTLCELTGKEYTHSVFIPGSHIVLNIERDFEKWIGEDVVIVPQKFVEFRKNVRAGLVENSLVGSRKRVLQIKGLANLTNMYNKYLLSKQDNVTVTPDVYKGTVTGIINSNNKTGIFIELNDMYVTGLMPVSALDLLDYKPGDEVNVIVQEFEVQEGKEAFTQNKKGNVVKCNARVVFAPAL